MKGFMGDGMKDWGVAMRGGLREGFLEEVTPELGKKLNTPQARLGDKMQRAV